MKGASTINNKFLSFVLAVSMIVSFLPAAVTASSVNTTVDEPDYVAGEAIFLADTIEEALDVADAYGAELKKFSNGIALLGEKESTTFTAESIHSYKAVAVQKNLPVISLNYYMHTADVELKGEGSKKVSSELSANIEAMEDWYAQDAFYNDPLLSYQWHFDVIDAEDAWAITDGTPNVIVAVIDSGIDVDHPDLVSNIYSAEDFFSFDDNFDLQGHWVSSNNYPHDDGGHGTHVSGIIAGSADNYFGIAGVASGVQILSLKALGNVYDETEDMWYRGTGSTYDIMDAFARAMEVQEDTGCEMVINMSLGGGSSLNEFQTLINEATAQGITVVAAVGNDHVDIDVTPHYPSNYNNVIGVAAAAPFKNDDYPTIKCVFDTSYSNFGSAVDITAPGTSIASTYLGGQYVYLDGTSMACPVVAGVAALLESAKPDLTPAQIESIIESTATASNINGIYFDQNKGTDAGAGLINAGAALESLFSITINNYGPFTAGNQPVAEPTASQYSTSISGTVTFTYYTDGAGTVKTTATNSGAAAEGGAPKNAGVYYVQASVSTYKSQIYQFVIGSSIASVELELDAPDAWMPMSNITKAGGTYGESGYVVYGATWSPSGTRFAEDTAYSITYKVKTVDGNVFAAVVTATVNGATATVTRNSNTDITVTYTFEKTAKISPYDVPYEESFEVLADNTLPKYWTAIDADGDGYTWDALNFRGYGANTTYGCVASASAINGVGPLSPDNWLISPEIQLGTDSELSFYVGGVDADYFSEYFGVYISTEGSATTDFVQLHAQYVQSVNYTKVTIDLSDYDGEIVRIAFRHYNVIDVYWMLIDEISITGTPIPVQPTVKYGDVNGDDAITTADIDMVLDHILEVSTLTADQITAADVNGDDAVTTADIDLILDYILEEISSFPVEE